jgi:acyl-CoA dehydrogenase
MSSSFELTGDQKAVADNVGRIVADFDEAYWAERDTTGTFPEEFRQAIAKGGWLGIAMPEEVGGAGLGITEAAIMMEKVANSPGAMSAASSIHMNIFGPHVIVAHGTDEQRKAWLPSIICDDIRVCFGVTEPDAGLDTTHIKTAARRDGGDYVIDGRKIWTSVAQQAHRVVLLTRTTPIEEVEKPTDGMTLFFAELDSKSIEIQEIAKMGRHAVNSNMLFIDSLRVPEGDRIGEEGRGFYYLLDSLNPERILIGSEGVGIGRQALARATEYARERVVFGRPIGQNQAIQHPLAQSWMELEAAWLSCMRAASYFDAGKPCGPEANAAKYLGSEAGFKACERAVLTHGGMGYAKEYHVERLMREVMINRLAPVSQQLILCHIAERTLGLPKSY